MLALHNLRAFQIGVREQSRRDDLVQGRAREHSVDVLLDELSADDEAHPTPVGEEVRRPLSSELEFSGGPVSDGAVVRHRAG